MKQVALLVEGHLLTRTSIQAAEPQEGGTLRHRRRFAWCQVPEKLIEHQQLSHAAVRLGAWLAGRPEGWVVHKNHARSVLRLSDDGWRRALSELRKAGYLETTPRRGAGGKMAGQDYLFDSTPGLPCG